MVRTADALFELARMMQLAAVSLNQPGLLFSWKVLAGLAGINTRGKSDAVIMDETLNWINGFLSQDKLKDELRKKAMEHYRTIFGYAIETGAISIDKAMVKEDYGGIDLNSANLAMNIKRDGKGVPLPFVQQDMAALSGIEGFVPNIIEIKPVTALPIFDELRFLSR